jgi:uncharacterized OB-fold protein
VPSMKAPLQGPEIPRDFAFFYEGLRDRRLLVQQCSRCRHLRHPPSPSCPRCLSLEWEAVDAPLDGTVHSFVIHHYPVFPDYESPHVVVLVDLGPNLRMVGALFGAATRSVTIGMPVRAGFASHAEGFVFHYFEPVDAE